MWFLLCGLNENGYLHNIQKMNLSSNIVFERYVTRQCQKYLAEAQNMQDSEWRIF